MTEYWILLLIMTFMGSVASLFLKRASCSNGIFEILKNINFYVGGCLYLGAAIINIIVLRYLDYSVVLPLTSITYIWTMVLSFLILKEKITAKKIVGVCLVIVGASVVSM